MDLSPSLGEQAMWVVQRLHLLRWKQGCWPCPHQGKVLTPLTEAITYHPCFPLPVLGLSIPTPFSLLPKAGRTVGGQKQQSVSTGLTEVADPSPFYG